MGVALDTESVEHKENGGGRRAGARAGGGPWAGSGYSTPKEGVLQQDPVEYRGLCWTRRLLSIGCCVGHEGYGRGSGKGAPEASSQTCC